MSQEILALGKKYFPNASDEEIMGKWDQLKADNPGVTPAIMTKILPKIMASQAAQRTPEVSPLQVPQAQVMPNTPMPTTPMDFSKGSGGLDFSGLSAASKYSKKKDAGLNTEEDDKAIKMKALQSLFGGGK